MAPCVEIKPMAGDTMGDLAQDDFYLVDIYIDCAVKLNALQKWVSANN